MDLPCPGCPGRTFQNVTVLTDNTETGVKMIKVNSVENRKDPSEEKTRTKDYANRETPVCSLRKRFTSGASNSKPPPSD